MFPKTILSTVEALAITNLEHMTRWTVIGSTGIYISMTSSLRFQTPVTAIIPGEPTLKIMVQAIGGGFSSNDAYP
jgi:hypothetical protein